MGHMSLSLCVDVGKIQFSSKTTTLYCLLSYKDMFHSTLFSKILLFGFFFTKTQSEKIKTASLLSYYSTSLYMQNILIHKRKKATRNKTTGRVE